MKSARDNMYTSVLAATKTKDNSSDDIELVNVSSGNRNNPFAVNTKSCQKG